MSAVAREPGLDLDVVLSDLTELLSGVRRIGVAYSGGVDSSVLLALCARALGPGQVLAILGVSPSLAARERTAAHDVARSIGLPVLEVSTFEGADPRYRENGADRCFFCKDELFGRIDAEVLTTYALDAVAYGENADDAVRVDRPGSRAATDHRVLRPLADLGLRKTDVRALARELGLPNADKPAAPCLASRIPHGEPVTREKLAQIDQAEAALADLGLREFRVRHHGDVARLEIGDHDLAALAGERRRLVQRAVREAGFRYVTVDLGGLQSGLFTLTALKGDGPSTSSGNVRDGSGNLSPSTGSGNVSRGSGNVGHSTGSGNV